MNTLYFNTYYDRDIGELTKDNTVVKEGSYDIGCGDLFDLLNENIKVNHEALVSKQVDKYIYFFTNQPLDYSSTKDFDNTELAITGMVHYHDYDSGNVLLAVLENGTYTNLVGETVSESCCD